MPLGIGMFLNLRSTVAYVTDEADQVCLPGKAGSATELPPYAVLLSFRGQSFKAGWLIDAGNPDGARNRSATVDKRVAGAHGSGNSAGAPKQFWVELSDGPGFYEIRLAAGDPSGAGTTNPMLQIFDGNILLATINGTAGISGHMDAVGRNHTAANWPSQNTAIRLWFNSRIGPRGGKPILRINCGDTSVAGSTSLNAIGIKQISKSVAWAPRRIYIDYAVGGGISGTSSVTLDAVTTAAASTLQLKAGHAVTLENVTTSGPSKLFLVGASSAQLADVSTGATGALPIVGTSAVTLGDVTTSSAGAVQIKGAVGVTLGDVTSGGVGVLPIVSAGGGQLADVTTTATGVGVVSTSGVSNVTLADASGSAAGTVQIKATVAVTLGDVTTEGPSKLYLVATSSAQLDSVQSSSTATLRLVASGGVTLGDVTTSAAAGSAQQTTSLPSGNRGNVTHPEYGTRPAVISGIRPGTINTARPANVGGRRR